MNIDGKQKALALTAHISYLFFGVGFIAVPLVIYLVFDKKDDFVAHHAKQALFAQAIFGIVSAIAGILTFIAIGILLWPLVAILGAVLFVCSLIGSYRVINGESYSYPLLG